MSVRKTVASSFGVWLALVGIMVSPSTVFAGGTIKGKVVFDGAAPAAETVDTPGDKKSDCHEGPAKITLNNLIVSKEGGIKDVVVSLEGKGEKPAAKGAEFDQKGCLFTSPVVVVTTGSKVTMKNSDPGAHNVRTSALSNKPINVTLAPGETREYETTAAESITVNCDIHPWMKAAIVVLDTGVYAVTNENGEFEIKDVPAGEYKFKAWHATLGKAKDAEGAPKTVVVEDGKTVELTIKKKPKQ